MMAFEDFTKELMDRLAIRLGEDYRIHVTDTLKNNSVVQPQLVFQGRAVRFVRQFICRISMICTWNNLTRSG